MKITKFEHACIVIEEQGQSLVIDPGDYTRELGDLQNVAAVVFTHVHGDHYGAANLAAILKANPNAKVFGTHEVAAAAPNTTAVDAGQTVAAGPFKLAFFGGRHALVYKDTPQNENVGVMVNDRFYYPGDSFDTPNGLPVEILALPVSGPWMKTGEALEFIEAIKPSKLCIPTHDALLSPLGMKMFEGRAPSICAEFGATFKVLQPGESTEA
jgi:L-ascorbate metabolism protein UlaG (beta-lactamase superfamily)